MRTIGNFDFPDTSDDARVWEARVFAEHLSPEVMAVARTRIEGRWSAYVAPIDSDDKDALSKVLRWGTKMREPHARAIFPNLSAVRVLML